MLATMRGVTGSAITRSQGRLEYVCLDTRCCQIAISFICASESALIRPTLSGDCSSGRGYEGASRLPRPHGSACGPPQGPRSCPTGARGETVGCTLLSSVLWTLSPASRGRGQPRAVAGSCAGGLHGWPRHCVAPAVALPALRDVRTMCQLRERPVGEVAQPERARHAQVATALQTGNVAARSRVVDVPRLATMMTDRPSMGIRYRLGNIKIFQENLPIGIFIENLWDGCTRDHGAWFKTAIILRPSSSTVTDKRF